MELSDARDLKVALQLAGLRANKGLGQHFLVDRDSLNLVMAAGELGPEDTILEIGPGLGAMTMPLADRVKQVVAVEADQTLAEILRTSKPENVAIHHQDIMEFNLGTLPEGYKVVSNIPYYLTSPIFRLFLEAENRPRLMSLLVQKEVAQRVAATPGQMSVLAFSVQYYGQPALTAVVERHKFWPPPKVDSAVLQIQVYDQPAFEADRDKLFRLVKAGFGEKRKMLKNSLAGGLNISVGLAEGWLRQAKLAPTARAQELSLEQWERLYRAAVKADVL